MIHKSNSQIKIFFKINARLLCIPRHLGQKSFFFKKDVHSANKFKNTQLNIIRCFNYQNYILIRYYMLHNIEICICMKSKICIGRL